MYRQKRKFILGSSSPRRKDYFERYKFDFEIVKPDIPELVNEGESPEAFVKRISHDKALSILDKVEGDQIIITADTIVCLGDQILGKPKDYDDAFKTLNMLSGKEHTVMSAYCLFDNSKGNSLTNICKTQVTFNILKENEIKAYLRLNEAYDKAGSYSIQELGTVFIHSIHGSFNNVVGLPIEMLIRDLVDNDWLQVKES